MGLVDEPKTWSRCSSDRQPVMAMCLVHSRRLTGSIDSRVPEEDARSAGGIEIHDVGKPQQQPGECKIDPGRSQPDAKTIITRPPGRRELVAKPAAGMP